jgi:YspA, cpYpsA-related SLOG family
MIVLVTGSRDWPDAEMVADILDLTEKHYGPITTIVHGACPTGADAAADAWAVANDCGVERVPADWTKHGRSAGPLRNREMIRRGADLCLAFIGPCTRPRCIGLVPHDSHGASGCSDMARRAGIRTFVYRLGTVTV